MNVQRAETGRGSSSHFLHHMKAHLPQWGNMNEKPSSTWKLMHIKFATTFDAFSSGCTCHTEIKHTCMESWELQLSNKGHTISIAWIGFDIFIIIPMYKIWAFCIFCENKVGVKMELKAKIARRSDFYTEFGNFSLTFDCFFLAPQCTTIFITECYKESAMDKHLSIVISEYYIYTTI